MPHRQLLAAALAAFAIGILMQPVRAAEGWEGRVPEGQRLLLAQAEIDNPGWYGRQHNAQGGYCCSAADGHIYDGDYALNADGSVTIPAPMGGTINIETGKVLAFNPADPNPTGHAVIWYTGVLSAETTANIYCFAIGALT